jgi:hypothetical protein
MERQTILIRNLPMKATASTRTRLVSGTGRRSGERPEQKPYGKRRQMACQRVDRDPDGAKRLSGYCN